MEDCKKRARAEGLKIDTDTIEYIVSNKDILQLAPKYFIPTLYDHWFQEVEIVKNKWIYEIFPFNPYEIVVNTRPAISYYNQDNSCWVNVMLFYHVLAHIDFFHNNIYFRHTWADDFCGQALADKRLIDKIRQDLGPEKRWVDYVIEFASNIDNLVGYFPQLKQQDFKETPELLGKISEKVDFYFGEFLRSRYEKNEIDLKFFYEEIDRYNLYLREYGQKGEIEFFEDHRFLAKFPEFNNVYKKRKEKKKKEKPRDILEYIMENSQFLNKEKNKWMKDIMAIIRRTSLYFQPHLRTRICNEGWATFWEQKLFVGDPRIKTHEIDYSLLSARTLFHPRIGLNIYALGQALWEFIFEMAKKGKLSREYQIIQDIEARKRFDEKKGVKYAKQILFELRRYFDDYQLINFLTDEDFQDFLNQNRLFTAGIRPHRDLEKRMGGLVEIYIKSKKARDFRELINKFLYHPPHIVVDEEKAKDGELYLNHIYEGRTLVSELIPGVLIGLEFLWGKPVSLETTEYEGPTEEALWYLFQGMEIEFKKVRVIYRCQNKKVERKVIS